MELDIMAMIQEYAVIPVAVVCLLIGVYLKKNSKFPNRFIPPVLAVVALVLVLWMKEWTFTPENVFSGIYSAALAVYIHQTGKHLFTSHGNGDNVEEPNETPDAGGGIDG